MTKKYKLEQFDTTAKERDRLDLAVSDLINDRVVWGKWFSSGWLHGKYRVGISRMGVYGLAIQVFRHPGQRDSVRVYDLEPWQNQLRILRNSSECWEPNILALNSAIEAEKSQEAAA